MGHANLTNLSRFVVRRLYAKGRLTLKNLAVQAAQAKEYLHTSEGDYEGPHEIASGLVDVLDYLTCEDPTKRGYSGPAGGGPWLVPALEAWQGRRNKVSPWLAGMLDVVAAGLAPPARPDPMTVAMAADKLEEEGHGLWAAQVRTLTARQEALCRWCADKGFRSDWDEVPMPGGEGSDWHLAFDHIPWRIATPWRMRFREIPVLGNVSH